MGLLESIAGNKTMEKLVLSQLKKVVKDKGIKAIIIVPDQDGNLEMKAFLTPIEYREIPPVNISENKTIE